MPLQPTNITLDSGFMIISDLLAKGEKAVVGQARVGSAINFIPNTSGIFPSPSVIAILDSSCISVDIINNNEVRFSITFSELLGNFDVGNIMLDLQVNGIMIPFQWWVSDVVISKIKPSDNDVGNRFIVSFITKFQNILDAIVINVTSPFFSSLPSYSTELTTPSPIQSLYQQFVVQQYTTTRVPALGMRRSGDNRYFGFPFLQRLDHPFFGVLSGGYIKDNYYPYPGDIYWGGYFITPTTDYISPLNGGNFTDTLFNNIIICDKFDYLPT